MKYRKKPVVIDATQWFKNGDHPEDGKGVFPEGDWLCHGCKVLREQYEPPDAGFERALAQKEGRGW
jgi:hypothetical protein